MSIPSAIIAFKNRVTLKAFPLNSKVHKRQLTTFKIGSEQSKSLKTKLDYLFKTKGRLSNFLPFHRTLQLNKEEQLETINILIIKARLLISIDKCINVYMLRYNKELTFIFACSRFFP